MYWGHGEWSRQWASADYGTTWINISANAGYGGKSNIECDPYDADNGAGGTGLLLTGGRQTVSATVTGSKLVLTQQNTAEVFWANGDVFPVCADACATCVTASVCTACVAGSGMQLVNLPSGAVVCRPPAPPADGPSGVVVLTAVVAVLAALALTAAGWLLWRGGYCMRCVHLVSGGTDAGGAAAQTRIAGQYVGPSHGSTTGASDVRSTLSPRPVLAVGTPRDKQALATAVAVAVELVDVDLHGPGLEHVDEELDDDSQHSYLTVQSEGGALP